MAGFLLVAIAAALAACQFSPGTLDPGGNGDPPPDADPSAPDADPSAPDASGSPNDGSPGENCGWSFAPRHFDPCAPANPTGLAPLVLGADGTYSYNTDTELFLDPNGEDVVPKPPDTLEQGGEVRALWVNGLDIQSGSTLRVEGSRPLMIVSTAEIQVSGILDLSSTWDPDTLTYDPAAGADPPSDECATSNGENGGDCASGAGGGGGAGFGGAGADGGRGAGMSSCGTGGTRGDAVSPPANIRGGCKGARGGNGEVEMLYGLGGFGGGAVYLVSMVKVTIDGTIQAGGAAGSGAENSRSGGGGGGSGGFIGLEALEIEIGSSAILAANGGAGGGGCNQGLAESGEDGKASDQAALGGAGESRDGGRGGNGSAGSSLGGEPGEDVNRGGGGGGGGAGYIVTYQDSAPTVAGGAVISPPLTER